MHLGLGHVRDLEDAGIIQLQREDRIAAGLHLAGDLQLHADLILPFGAALLRLQPDLHVDVGLTLYRAALLDGDILERQVADELAQDLQLRHLLLRGLGCCRAACSAVCSAIGGVVRLCGVGDGILFIGHLANSSGQDGSHRDTRGPGGSQPHDPRGGAKVASSRTGRRAAVLRRTRPRPPRRVPAEVPRGVGPR